MSPINSKNRATDVSTQRTIILTLQLLHLGFWHFWPKISKMAILPSRGAHPWDQFWLQRPDPIPGPPKPIPRPLGTLLTLPEVSFDLPDLSQGAYFVSRSPLRLPSETLQFLQSLSAIYTKNRPNSDISPFDLITPEREICIKKASFFGDYLYLIALWPVQKPNWAIKK